MTETPLYGLMAEFDNPTDLLHAAKAAHEAGYRRLDAYTPYPIEEVSDAIGFTKTSVPLIVLVGGILGGLSGYLLQYWVNVSSYPLNIGGRPLNSWPAFVIITFEMTILFAGITAVVGMLALNGLPMPYHPVFNNPRFSAASRDRFFLCIEAADPQFDLEETGSFMRGLNAVDVTEVED
ncbi:MAG TPA: DUF3341 domain-containing protein [candidate division Zixibacteria bacterium]|nr:DUF3341 domain-containing protein [candidate division Zixibacteria bacterium]